MNSRPDQLIRQGAGVIDRSGRGRIVVRGADRKTFLHALLTNDIAGLAPGSGCYAALLTPQGRMVADMHVFEMGDVVLIDCVREVKDTLLQKFDAFVFSEDVQLGDLTDAWGCVGVYGPEAARVASRALEAGKNSAPAGIADGIADGIAGGIAGAIAALDPYGNVRLDALGDVVVVARVDGLGLPGYLLFASMGLMAQIGNAALAAGAALVEPETAELLRIEAGEPAFLVDMTTETIPPEAGIESSAVSFTKGCFPGQEVIVRIRDRGHGRVAQRLVAMGVSGTTVPSAGDRVWYDAKEVGHVTSAVQSPSRGGPLALGYVRRDVAEDGRTITIICGEAHLDATVFTLPFAK
jgi:folate-binding protein YgfZ